MIWQNKKIFQLKIYRYLSECSLNMTNRNQSSDLDDNFETELERDRRKDTKVRLRDLLQIQDAMITSDFGESLGMMILDFAVEEFFITNNMTYVEVENSDDIAILEKQLRGLTILHPRKRRKLKSKDSDSFWINIF